MRSYIITIPPLWGRGEGGGASKVIYDLDAMRNKLQSMPCRLGLRTLITKIGNWQECLLACRVCDLVHVGLHYDDDLVRREREQERSKVE